ncbi:KAT8 regulatory NSL complex subunit 2 isoform X2 [Chelonus insularis]|uniref:KAT8 regulatory NSL complex subunit 2 isoform X2 n=1 Tax=Chelonus insularis TaxID=460826 RepID=UPI001589D4A3|nr:KAT8 regulatory NSL complex subunit 2 isoform X2 [Chelonus insularis]
MFRAPKTVIPATTMTSTSATTVASTTTATSPIQSTLNNLQTSQKQKCAYESYNCTQQCLEGYSYCMKHILEDPKAPYKQCAFIYNTNGRKCYNPAAKLDRRDTAYCTEHTRKAQLARIKSTSRHSLPPTPEGLLLNLTHYAHKPIRLPNSLNDVGNDKKLFKALDPFSEVDAFKVNAKSCEILDYASSSDSDIEPTVTNEAFKGTFLDDSDNESLHSPQEDPLKHAGIFTAEEVIYIAREKLIKLQSLYIEQFRRLQYTLREKRRKYLHLLKKEKEALCSIHDQPKETAKEKKIYEKLKALNRYHRKSGVEAILYRKSLEKRAKVSEGISQKPPNIPKCIFTEGGVKCGERTLPSAKHCQKHILKDQNQVLFKACGAIRADIECHEPIPVIFDSKCVYHMDLPPPCKLEPMIFKESREKPEKPQNSSDMQFLEIDVVGDQHQEIDPDDDMAGLMREMNDTTSKKHIQVLNESINSENSTDTAFSLTAQSDKDEVASFS